MNNIVALRRDTIEVSSLDAMHWWESEAKMLTARRAIGFLSFVALSR